MMANVGYLALAYMLLWGCIFIYMFFISKRQKALERKMKLLEERVSEEEVKE